MAINFLRRALIQSVWDSIIKKFEACKLCQIRCFVSLHHYKSTKNCYNSKDVEDILVCNVGGCVYKWFLRISNCTIEQSLHCHGNGFG